MDPSLELQTIKELINSVHKNDLIIDSNGLIFCVGPQLLHLFGEFNPVGQSFFDVFTSKKLIDINSLDASFLSIHEIDTLRSDYISQQYYLDAEYNVLLESYRYVKIKIGKTIHASNRIATDLIKQIDPELSVEDFLLSVLYNLPSDLGIFNLEHQYVYLNPAAVSNGEIRDFLVGKTDFDYCELRGVDTKMAEGRRVLFNQVFSNKATTYWEDSHPQSDGSVKTVLRRFSPIFASDQKMIGVLGYGIDISQVKTAQQLAQFNEERFKSLFENNMAGVFRTTEAGEILDINESYAKIFGFESVEDLKNQRTSSFYPNPEARESYLKVLKEKGSLQNYVLQNKRKDGQLIELLANVKYRKEGNTGVIEGTLIDITALSQANQQLEEQKKDLERLAYFLDQTTDAVQVVDEDGHFVYLNKTGCERLGIERENITNHTVFEIEKFFTSKKQWQDHLITLQKLGKINMETTHVNCKTGEKIPVEITVIPRVFDGKKYFITTSKDITDKIEARKVLEQKNKFVKDLTDAVNTSSLVSVADKHGKIINVNSRFAEVSGFSVEELLGSDHSIVNSGYHTKEFWSDMYKTIFSGKVWRAEVRNKAKDGTFYWVNTVIYPILDENRQPYEFMSIRQVITDAKLNEGLIKKQINFQNLVIRTSSKLINLNPEDLDAALNEALKDIGLFVDADRSYIFDYNIKNQTINNLYEWCREGITPQIDELQNVPFSEVPAWIDVHFKGQIMDIPSVAALESSKLKELLEVQDIKSLLAIPMMDGDKCIGFIGFDAVREEHNYNETDKIILELFSEMIVNINKRIEFIQEIEIANKKYIEINENLEKTVAEKTAKNNELTQMMSNQDKLAMIGEITAGITHDLNTPMGAIKVGAESIRYTLENLFKKVIEKCSIDQLHYACNRSVNHDVQMFVGGLQMLRETQSLSNYLQKHYPKVEDIPNLSSALVKARILENEPEVIEKILTSDNPIEFIDLIYHIQSTRTFVDTVLEAGDKSASVIKNLRFYLKEGGTLEKTHVNIKNNIRTVLNVFNHQIKHNVDLHFNVPEDLEVIGYENKLYQLWSNLIKNAIDAIGEKGKLIIDAKRENGRIEVSVKNTGKMIPIELQDKIFEKFFTTKDKSNGTGLGLSIVKKVVEEHGAKIKLNSNEEFTSFIVTFEKESL